MGSIIVVLTIVLRLLFETISEVPMSRGLRRVPAMILPFVTFYSLSFSCFNFRRTAIFRGVQHSILFFFTSLPSVDIHLRPLT